MKHNLEIEYKTLLNEQNYLTLQDSWNFSDGEKQINVYLDTPDETLYKQSIMCRIRLTDTVEFTLKIPQENGVIEKEMILDSFDLADNEAISSLLLDYGVDAASLTEIARSTTLRKTFEDTYGTWCLDYTEFDHGSDYEVEYELFEDNPKAFEHYLNQLKSLGIEYKKSRPKYIRARFPE